MTSPTEEPGFLFRLILDKLDVLDRKLDGQAEKLVGHEIRISSLEKSLEEQKAAKTGNWKIWAAFATAVFVAVLSWLLPLIAK